MDHFLELLGYLLTGMLAFHLTEKRRQWRLHKHAAKTLSSSIETDSKINASLAQLLYALHADRAKLFRHHNGGHYINFQSIKKFSLTHMQIRPGISTPVPSTLKDLASSFFPNMLRALLKSHDATMHWHANEAPDAYLRALHASEGTSFVKVTGIRDNVGQMLGFLSIEWLTDQPRENKERVRLILQFAQEIGLLLSQDYKY